MTAMLSVDVFLMPLTKEAKSAVIRRQLSPQLKLSRVLEVKRRNCWYGSWKYNSEILLVL